MPIVRAALRWPGGASGGIARVVGGIVFGPYAGAARRPARRRDQQPGLDALDGNLLLDVRLDVRQAHRVEIAGEADRVALGAQARGAADAMHVVLGVVRQVVVEHVR